MHRFYIDPDLHEPFEIGRTLVLPEGLAHQIRNVLRLKVGDGLTLFTGDGREWNAELVQTTGRMMVRARLSGVSEPKVEMDTRIIMAMALTRPQRYELALAKCAELGAYAFTPITSERVLKSESDVSVSRMNRWNRIVREAAELSGRVRVPTIAQPRSLAETLEVLLDSGAKIIFLWEQATGVTLVDLLRRYGNGASRAADVALILGPVGGFSESEAAMASASGAEIASLGPRILRTETAAIASMSLTAQLLP